MVLNFIIFPDHLQNAIAEKLEYCDFVRFRESSKHGRDVGGLVKTKIAMDVELMTVTTINNKEQFFMRRNYDSIIHYWENVRYRENCPHFCTKTFDCTVNNMTNERLAEIVREAEEGFFSGKRTKLNIRAPKEPFDMDLFSRFLKVFDVVEIKQSHRFGPMDRTYFKLPIFREVENINVSYSFIEDKDLLALKAHSIQCNSESPNLRSVLNQLLKEWFSKNREINLINLKRRGESLKEWSEEDRKEIFSDLPVNILWSNETHESSILSIFNIRSLQNFTDNGKSFYTLSRGTETLFIYITDSEVSCFVEDEPEEILVCHLPDPVREKYRKLYGTQD